MLTEIAPGVLVHESEFIKSSTVVVEGRSGVLLVDPGVTSDDLRCLADDLDERAVVAGFSTHGDWDHVLWSDAFGTPPRYSTAAAASAVSELVSQPDWRSELTPWLPPEHAGEIPLDVLGLVTALPEHTTVLPWAGPEVRILEHRAHAPGHAALLIPDVQVLVAGDMLSDILVPFLDLSAADPVGDYLVALAVFESIVDTVDVVVPGHGSVGSGRAVRERIALDRAYVEALRDGSTVDDPRIGPSAPLDWMTDVHEGQLNRLRDRPDADGFAQAAEADAERMT